MAYRNGVYAGDQELWMPYNYGSTVTSTLTVQNSWIQFNTQGTGGTAGYPNNLSTINNQLYYNERLLTILPPGISTGNYVYWSTDVSGWALGRNNVTLGENAGPTGSGKYGIALGTEAARYLTADDVIAIGRHAGYSNASTMSVSIGAQSGETNKA
jgi:hypothetical protein